MAARPLFDLHDLEGVIERALEPRVSLPSGGHLVIEQTEAMTTIDVNSGTYVDSANLEDTAYRINLEAARAIPGELRLRNIGGIVVVDFIDMACANHRDGIVAALLDAAREDPARFQASGFSELGLVEISRATHAGEPAAPNVRTLWPLRGTRTCPVAAKRLLRHLSRGGTP